MSYMRGAAGIGGWLAFLIVLLGFFVPLGWLLNAWSTTTGNYIDIYQRGGREVFQIARWTIAILASLGSVLLAWRLNSFQQRNTVPIAIAGLWLLALLPVLAELAAMLVTVRLLPGGIGALAIGIAFRPFLFASIWTAYLLNSERVRNTYRDDESESVDLPLPLAAGEA